MPQSEFHISCDGRTLYDEDVAIFGTYQIDETQDLGVFGSIGQVVDHIEKRVACGDIAPDDEDAAGFIPKLFRVHDDEGRLVLVGEPWRRGVRWSRPVETGDEEDEVRAVIQRLEDEAFLEARWDNSETARGLRHQAAVERGRLVDPVWRIPVARLLAQREV